MKQVSLLSALPKTQRNVQNRSHAKTPEIIAESKKFGQMYFDGPREYGYGGYKYDGRWVPVARDIVAHYDLKPGMRVLDVGCAKGFLVKDLMGVLPGLEVFGLDISRYALDHCEAEAIGRLHLGSAGVLPFPNLSFDFVISINIIHNFRREKVLIALEEIQRVSKGRSFVQVDAYENEAEKKLFEEWVLTAEYHGYPEKWIDLFKKAGYTGDYDWTILRT